MHDDLGSEVSAECDSRKEDLYRFLSECGEKVRGDKQPPEGSVDAWEAGTFVPHFDNAHKEAAVLVTVEADCRRAPRTKNARRRVVESLARQYEIRTIARFLALLNNGSFVVSPTEDEVTLQPAPPKYASKYEDLVLQQMGKKYGSL